MKPCTIYKSANLLLVFRLFVHEVFRVFYDRLVDDSDREWLYKLTRTMIKDHFKENYDTLFEHLAQTAQPVRSRL